MTSLEAVSAPHSDYYESLFKQLNTFGTDQIEAAPLAAFLKSARGVNVGQLSQIWEIASELSGCKNRGALNKLGVFMCFKLVAAIQQGLPLGPGVLAAPLPGAPQFGGPSPHPSASFATPPPHPPAPPKSPSVSSELGAAVPPALAGWPIGAEEQRKYEAIFDSLGPGPAGKLGGDQCKPVLLNSQLPKALLAKIWDLADMDGDGFLDRPEFCVALHLVYKALQQEHIPDQLPPALIPHHKRGLIRRMSCRSADPMAASHPHPPPLSWSSRASSIASLNYFPTPAPMAPALPPAPIIPPGRPLLPPPSAAGDSGNLPGAKSSLFDRNLEEWRVEDVGQYEAEFNRLDTDRDGLVGGADVREVFLRSGLPQQMLARIWAHVDVARTGKLDLEQYAKCVELIRECQIELGANQPPAPESQGAASPPVPSGAAAATALTRRDSQVSNATNASSTGASKTPVAENQRVTELEAQIEEIQQGRRQAEQDLFQSEADLKVKNSEIRNLEIELLTLTATVKQLKSQKGEANKRLNDLDMKIVKLEGLCEENKKRLEEDEARLAKTRGDIQNAKENSQAEEEVLAQLRAEVQARRAKRDATRARLREQNAKFEGFVDELTQLERGMAKNEEECARMRADMAEMARILAGVEKGEEEARRELMERTFEEPGASRSGSMEAGGRGSADQQQQFGKAAGNSTDPFGGDTAAEDPFGPKTGGQPQQFANFANFGAFS